MSLNILEQRTALIQAGLKDRTEMQALNAAVKENPAVYALSQSIAKDPTVDDDTQKKFLTALGKKWKADPAVFNKLEADMKADPALAGRIATTVKSNPDIMVASLQKYAGGDLLPKPAVAPAPAQAANAPAAPTPPNGPGQQPPAAAAPPAQAANSPAPPKAQAPEKDQEIEFLTALAGLSDADMKKQLDKGVVKDILKGMADQAETKFGVSAATVAGFKNRIGAGDPKLADDKLLTQITTNFQNNPEFVRQLAKSAKNKEPMDKAMVDMARPIMTGVMENPEKLADDNYVKDLSQKMNMGSTMGGFGKILNNIFGEGFGGKISGWFHAIVDQIKTWISGFTGDKQVISMKSAGNGSLLPTVMVNLDAINANRDAAAAQARYSPLEMTALSKKGADGKFFHNEQVTGSDGKPAVTQDGQPVLKTVMNDAYTITDINGKQHSVMPSVGQLAAKQDKDGNFYGRFVTKINQNGVSDELATYQVSAAEFKKYEASTNQRAKEAGLNQTLAFSPYTAQDAANAAKPQTIQMVTVDPKTSAASPPTTVAVGAPQEPSVGYTVARDGTIGRKPNEPSANDRDYRLQG
jgi:hypothetical protein